MSYSFHSPAQYLIDLLLYHFRLFKTDCLSLAEPLLVSYTYHDDERLGHMVRLRTDSDLKFILLQPDVIGKDDSGECAW